MSLGSKLLLALLILIIVLFAVVTPFGARQTRRAISPSNVERDSFPLLASIENRFGKKKSDSAAYARLRAPSGCESTGNRWNYMPGRQCEITLRPDTSTGVAYLVLKLVAGAGTVDYRAPDDSEDPPPQRLKADALLRLPVRAMGGVLTVSCPLGCVIEIPR